MLTSPARTVVVFTRSSTSSCCASVGSALFPSVFGSLAQFGRLVLLGEILGQNVSLNPAEVIFRDVQILGVSGVSRAMVEQAGQMVLEGRLRPVVGLELPLEQAFDAFRLVSERKPTGRIVLLPGPGRT